MTEDQYIEFQFVEETLKKFGYRLRDILVQDIIAKDLVSPGEGAHLKDSISFQVKQAGSMGGELLFFFPDYGRFIEIQYHKPSENTMKAFGKQNHALFTQKVNSIKRATRKDTRWYSRNTYGHLNELIGELMYGFTDAIREQMISELITPFK